MCEVNRFLSKFLTDDAAAARIGGEKRFSWVSRAGAFSPLACLLAWPFFTLSLNKFGRKQLPSNKAACKQNRHKHRHGDLGCLPFTKRFREIRLESKWNTTFWVVQQKISGNNERSEKVVLFFPDGIFQSEVRVPFLQSYL